MELFKAEERTVREILSKKEVLFQIPRNQRDYVWEDKQWKELGNDILDCIEYVDDKFINNEYFIGSCVFEKHKKNVEYIVDGQQRLTTLTIILSVLYDIFEELNHTKVLEGIYSYLYKTNDDGEQYLSIKNENLEPYYSEVVLFKSPTKDFVLPQNEQQKRIEKAYYFFKSFLKDRISVYENNDNKIAFLIAFRNQLLELKIIEISVSNEIDGYTVFEILNAKGKQLQLGDRMKNLILKRVNKTFPTDQAKAKWERIRKNIEDVSKSENSFTDFLNHYWISSYEKLKDEDEIYYYFKTKISKQDVLSFLNDLEINSEVYKEITLSDNRKITNELEFCLNSFKIFRNKQVRPILLSLYHNRRIGKLSDNQLLEILKKLENFHFLFSAITSTAANKIEKVYHNYASILKHKFSKDTLDSFLNELIIRKPKYDIFERNFLLKGYSHKSSDLKNNRSLVNYILQRIEYYKQENKELLINDLSIEHIATDDGEEQNAKIGNLLPLSKSLNENCGDDTFQNKLTKYKKSNFKTVQDFLHYNSTKTEWSNKEINERSLKISKLAYEKVWKL